MKIAKQKKKHRSRDTRYVVKTPATLNDYIRIYGMTSALLKEAQSLEKALRPAR